MIGNQTKSITVSHEDVEGLVNEELIIYSKVKRLTSRVLVLQHHSGALSIPVTLNGTSTSIPDSNKSIILQLDWLLICTLYMH